MTHKAISELAKLAGNNLEALIVNQSADIAEAISRTDKADVYRIGFTVAVDLEGPGVEFALTYGVKRRVVVEAAFDPNQLEMKLA